MVYGCAKVNYLTTLGIEQMVLRKLIKLIIEENASFFKLKNDHLSGTSTNRDLYHPNSSFLVDLLLKKHFALIYETVRFNLAPDDQADPSSSRPKSYKKRKIQIDLPFEQNYLGNKVELNFNYKSKQNISCHHGYVCLNALLAEQRLLEDDYHLIDKTETHTVNKLHQKVLTLLDMNESQQDSYPSRVADMNIGWETNQKKSNYLRNDLKEKIKSSTIRLNSQDISDVPQDTYTLNENRPASLGEDEQDALDFDFDFGAMDPEYEGENQNETPGINKAGQQEPLLPKDFNVPEDPASFEFGGLNWIKRLEYDFDYKNLSNLSLSNLEILSDYASGGTSLQKADKLLKLNLLANVINDGSKNDVLTKTRNQKKIPLPFNQLSGAEEANFYSERIPDQFAQTAQNNQENHEENVQDADREEEVEENSGENQDEVEDDEVEDGVEDDEDDEDEYEDEDEEDEDDDQEYEDDQDQDGETDNDSYNSIDESDDDDETGSISKKIHNAKSTNVMKNAIKKERSQVVKDAVKSNRFTERFMNSEIEFLKGHGLAKKFYICKNRCGTSYNKDIQNMKWTCGQCRQTNDINSNEEVTFVSPRAYISAIFRNEELSEEVNSSQKLLHIASNRDPTAESLREDPNIITWQNAFNTRVLKTESVKTKTSSGLLLGRGDNEKYYNEAKINLTAVLCLDGVDVNKRNATWPITLKILDLNGKSINHQCRLMSLPLFKMGNDGNDKEYNYSIDEFFNCLFDEFALMSSVGFYVHDVLDNTIKKVHLTITTANGDMPALMKLVKNSGHAGYSPCRYCLILKDTFKSQESNVLVDDIKERIRNEGLDVFDDIEALKTLLKKNKGVIHNKGGVFTHEDFDLPLKDKNYRNKIVKPLVKDKDLTSIIGFKEVTNYFKFDKPTAISIGPVMDVMHNQLEGIGQKMVKLIVDYKAEDFENGYMLTKAEIEKINKVLRRFKNLPVNYGEMIIDIRKIYKAEMYLNLMGWLSVLLISTSLKPELKELFIGFSHIIQFCFSRYIYKYQIPKITSFIETFVRKYEKCFRSRRFHHMVIVAIHEMIHIPKLVLHYGPLCNYSGFSIERVMAQFKRSFRGKKHAVKSLSKKEIGLFNIIECIKTSQNSTFEEELRKRVIEQSNKVLPLKYLKRLDVDKAKELTSSLKRDRELSQQKVHLIQFNSPVHNDESPIVRDKETSYMPNSFQGNVSYPSFNRLNVPVSLLDEIEQQLKLISNEEKIDKADIEVTSYTNLLINNCMNFEAETATRTPVSEITHYRVRKSLSKGDQQKKGSIALISSYGLGNLIENLKDGSEIFDINTADGSPDIEKSSFIFGIAYLKNFFTFSYKGFKISCLLGLVFEGLTRNTLKFGEQDTCVGFKIGNSRKDGVFRWLEPDSVHGLAHQFNLDGTSYFFLKEKSFNYDKFIKSCHFINKKDSNRAELSERQTPAPQNDANMDGSTSVSVDQDTQIDSSSSESYFSD